MTRKPPGPPPVDLNELVRAEDRVSFIYLERATVHRDGNAITVTDERGVVHVPAATIGSLLLGPGTRVTHQAMMLIAESGSTCVWVGENGVRYYGHGRTLTSSSRLIDAQARLVSQTSTRLVVARQMYSMRFPNEDIDGLTMQQLRGREGARVRNAYRDAADATGVEWRRRDYVRDDFTASDDINQAISAATTCLYGLCHSVIVALGASPALGFIHTGHQRSFVFDVADLYKAELAIPTAFRVVSTSDLEDLPGDVRRTMRDVIADAHLLGRCARDVRRLLLQTEAAEEDPSSDWDVVHLWDDREGTVEGGRDYGDEATW